MRSAVTNKEKATIYWQIHRGRGDEMLPFPLMGWIRCTADTAYDWTFSDYLNVVHLDSDGDFSAAEKITHTGALLIGTFDTFCGGDPDGYLENINNHMPTAKENKIIYIQNTGHTYQQKEQEFADKVTDMVREWRENSENK